MRLALTEDVGGGDATTDATVDAGARARAHIESNQEGILAGTAVAVLAFRELDPEVRVTWTIPEGGDLRRGARVAELEGKARAILSAERVALNFLQHLSGIATQARAFVKAVEGTGVTILDTRKTIPGLRILEKVAVLTGGASNHRFGLFDGILVKENHVRAAGGLRAAVTRALEAGRAKQIPVVVEVRTVEEAEEAAGMGVDRILLDNFTPTKVAETTRRLGLPRRPKAGGAAAEAGSAPELEVSGGVRLATIRDFALPGVSYISIGSLTHSAPALDLSLLVDEVL